jgi:hypothetical protein
MQKTLSQFDNITAAGILARTAISLSSSDNPSAAFELPDEKEVRDHLLNEIKKNLGINTFALSDSDIQRIENKLDEESDRLLDPVNEKAVLEDLSVKGELPTDLYDVKLSRETTELFGKQALDEEYLVRLTVQAADRVQHLNLDDQDFGNSPLISIFAKYFKNKYRNRSFTMLVTGIRQGLFIHVQSAWRIYSDLGPKLSRTLVDLLRSFADEFGIEFEIDGVKSKFFRGPLSSIHEAARQLRMTYRGPYVLAEYYKNKFSSGEVVDSMVYAVEIDRYLKKLIAYGWKEEKLTDWLEIPTSPC